jgi:hypothetical protein
MSSAVKYVAFALFALAGVRMWIALNAATRSYFGPDGSLSHPRALRRATRQMAHATALWELTVALVLVTLQGWAAFPNVIAIMGTAVIIWWTPRLTNQRRGDT